MDLKPKHLYPALVPLLPLRGENLLCPVLYTFLFLLFWFFLFSTFTILHVFHILNKQKQMGRALVNEMSPQLLFHHSTSFAVKLYELSLDTQ